MICDDFAGLRIMQVSNAVFAEGSDFTSDVTPSGDVEEAGPESATEGLDLKPRGRQAPLLRLTTL